MAGAQSMLCEAAARRKVIEIADRMTYLELNVDRVRDGFIEAGLLDASVKSSAAAAKPEEVLPRPPVLCSGCPHRGMVVAMKKLKLSTNGDIGCYTLGAVPPLSQIDTCLCMGASIGHTFGIEKAGKSDGNQIQ